MGIMLQRDRLKELLLNSDNVYSLIFKFLECQDFYIYRSTKLIIYIKYDQPITNLSKTKKYPNSHTATITITFPTPSPYISSSTPK